MLDENLSGHALQTLLNIRPLYFLPDDPLAAEVLIPAFGSAGNVDCMVGYFSSHVLSSLAPGLATYLAASRNSFRLIISPILSAEDQTAIEEGVKTREVVAREILANMIITENLIQRHTLKSLSWLLASGRMEIKVALMDQALFHPKVWLFQSGSDVIAVHGSSNVTYAGINKNIEQVAISKSWEDQNQRYVTDKLSNQFAQLWDDNASGCSVIPIPEAIRNGIVQTYHSDTPPTEAELVELTQRVTGASRYYDVA